MFNHVLTAVITVAIVSSMLFGFSVKAEICEKGENVAKQMNDEGIVLLKNENNALPLKNTETVALFGEAQVNKFDKTATSLTKQRGYIPFGAGSAWSVNNEEIIAPLDAFRKAQNENKISLYDAISNEYKKNIDYVPSESDVKTASENAQTAIMFISRWGGECRDFALSDWRLTEDEQQLLDSLRNNFSTVIAVLNTGSAIDTSWDTKVDGLIFASYGGFQGGQSICDIILGDVNPSGRLAFTWANSLEDYPTNDAFISSGVQNYTEDIYLGYRYFETFDKNYQLVKYCFGFGLSYTEFSAKYSFSDNGDNVTVSATVKNIGNASGKQVVQVYCSAPNGELGNPSKELCAFDKTNLLQPNEEQTLTLTFDKSLMASFDDVGKTGNASAYVLEAGTYNVFAGASVKDAGNNNVGSYNISELQVVKQLSAQVPTNLKKRLTSNGTLEEIPKIQRKQTETAENQQSNTEQNNSGNKYKLFQVLNGETTLDNFVKQMSNEELATFFVSYKGNRAGASDMVCALYGLKQFRMSDSSQGVGAGSTSYPCETIMASTWNLRLAAAYALSIASEAYTSNIDMILSPAVNIQRHPLSGRNFEYYSEDPLISGKFAQTVIENIQSLGVGSCIKHFACNEIESGKLESDSRVSERALREIYLFPFEMAIKNGKPWGVMSSYNLINGVPVSENGDLLINILRKEWGFEGFVTGDWNNNKNAIKEINNGNTVREPESNCNIDNVIKAINNGEISRETLENGAKNVLWVIMRTKSYVSTNISCANNHSFENGICTRCYALDENALNQVPAKIQLLLENVKEESTSNTTDEGTSKNNKTVPFIVGGCTLLAGGIGAFAIIKKKKKK